MNANERPSPAVGEGRSHSSGIQYVQRADLEIHVHGVHMVWFFLAEMELTSCPPAALKWTFQMQDVAALQCIGTKTNQLPAGHRQVTAWWTVTPWI